MTLSICCLYDSVSLRDISGCFQALLWAPPWFRIITILANAYIAATLCLAHFLSGLHVSTNLVPTTALWGIIIIIIVHMEIEAYRGCHVTREWQNQDSNSASLHTQPLHTPLKHPFFLRYRKEELLLLQLWSGATLEREWVFYYWRCWNEEWIAS